MTLYLSQIISVTKIQMVVLIVLAMLSVVHMTQATVPIDQLEKVFGYRLSVCLGDGGDGPSSSGGWCGYVPLPTDGSTFVDVASSSQDDSYRDLTAFSGMPIPFFHEPLFGDRPGLVFSGVSNGFLTPSGAGYDPYYDGMAYAGPIVRWPMIALYNADLFPPGSVNNMTSVRYSYITDANGVTSLLWDFNNVPLYAYITTSLNLTAQCQLFPNGTIIFRYLSVPSNFSPDPPGLVGLVLSDSSQFTLPTPSSTNMSRPSIAGYRLERVSAFGACPPVSKGCSSCFNENCVYCGDGQTDGFCVPPERAADVCMPGKAMPRDCSRTVASTGPYNTTLLGTGSIPGYVTSSTTARSTTTRTLPSSNWTNIQLAAPFPMCTASNSSIATYNSVIVWNASVTLAGAQGPMIAPISRYVSPGFLSAAMLVPQLTTVQTIAQDPASPFCVSQSSCTSTLFTFWNVSFTLSSNGALYTYAVEVGPSGTIGIYYIGSATVYNGELEDTFTTVPQFSAGLDSFGIPVAPLLPGRSVLLKPNLPVRSACPLCYNGGSCNADRSGCKCPVPFAGPRCEEKCTTAPYNCSWCNASSSYCTCTGCLCRTGFAGADCSSPSSPSTSDTRAEVAIFLLIVALSLPLLCYLVENVNKDTPDESPEKSLSKALPPPKPTVSLEDKELRGVLFPQNVGLGNASMDESNAAGSPVRRRLGGGLPSKRRLGRLHLSDDDEYDML